MKDLNEFQFVFFLLNPRSEFQLSLNWGDAMYLEGSAISDSLAETNVKIGVATSYFLAYYTSQQRSVLVRTFFCCNLTRK